MSKPILLLKIAATLLLLAGACQKDNETSSPDLSQYDDLHGEWRWIPHNLNQEFDTLTTRCTATDTLETAYWRCDWYDFDIQPNKKLIVYHNQGIVPIDAPFYDGDVSDGSCHKLRVTSRIQSISQWNSFKPGFITVIFDGINYELQLSNTRSHFRNRSDRYTRNDSYY